LQELVGGPRIVRSNRAQVGNQLPSDHRPSAGLVFHLSQGPRLPRRGVGFAQGQILNDISSVWHDFSHKLKRLDVAPACLLEGMG